jgi:hypothetical protein
MVNRSIFRPLQLLGIGLSLTLFAIASPAAGLAGKWSGTVDVRDSSSGSVISTPIELQLEEPQAGVVAGKIGREGENEAVAIRNGKLDGDHVTFEAGSVETTGSMKFTLILNGDHLEGQIKGAVDTQDIEGKVKLNKDKT